MFPYQNFNFSVKLKMLGKYHSFNLQSKVKGDYLDSKTKFLILNLCYLLIKNKIYLGLDLNLTVSVRVMSFKHASLGHQSACSIL